MDREIIDVEGMTCGGCVMSVEKALQRVPGVKKVDVSLAGKKAVVEGEGLVRARLTSAVEDAGFEAR